MAHTRRQFLHNLGLVTLATAAGPLVFRGFGSQAMAADFGAFGNTTLPPNTPILIKITLDGGNDDLSTLVPIDNPWYYDSTYGHGPIAIAAQDARADQNADCHDHAERLDRDADVERAEVEVRQRGRAPEGQS